MTPMRLSSLIVHAHPMRSPRWRRARVTKRANDLGRVRGLPPAARGEPCRGREVVEGHHGGDAPLAARRADPAVVVECGDGELALGGLDPAPLEREPIGAEPHGCDELDVLGPPMQRIACVPARLGTAGVRVVLPRPPVVVDVAALDLMGRGRRAPEEAFGEA